MDHAQLLKAALARRTHQPLARIRDDTALDQLPLDSFALVELLIELEHKHGIRLSLDDLRNLRTVGDLAARVVSPARAIAAAAGR